MFALLSKKFGGKMKTKDDVLRWLMFQLELSDVVWAKKLVTETMVRLKDMPEENCGNCKNSVFCKIRNQLLCIGNEMRGRITEEDFCSRFELKEKVE